MISACFTHSNLLVYQTSIAWLFVSWSELTKCVCVHCYRSTNQVDEPHIHSATAMLKGQRICWVTDIWLWYLGIMPIACDVFRTSYNLPVLYSYFNAFCISDVQHFELTLVSCWNVPQNIVTSRFCINKCAFVRYIPCNFVWKSLVFFPSGEW